jgi:hypothetical protein
MHFPEKYTVVTKIDMSKSLGGNAPQGFPFPFSDGAAGRKLRSAALQWARGNAYSHGKKYDAFAKEISFLNLPTAGFKIVQTVKRSREWFGSGATVFRIEDPRGFEFDITGPNMFEIMTSGTVEKGEIKGECIFARDGAKNALLLVDSEEYRETLNATNLKNAAAKFSLRDVSVGDWVMLADGVEATYLGKIHLDVTEQRHVLVQSSSYYSSRYAWVQERSMKERYVLVCRDSVNPYRLVSKANIASVTKPQGLTQADADHLLNQLMQFHDLATNTFGPRAIIHRWSRKKIKDANDK